MPLLLTTPLNPGDLDEAGPYTHLKIDWFAMLVPQNMIELVVSYGTMNGQTYTKGAASPVRKYEVRDADYVTMVQKLPGEGETIYAAAGRELYEWLIAKGYAAGTIV
jgi:hypothetical protein